MNWNRILGIVYQVGAYVIPASTFFGVFRSLFRRFGEMDSIEATSFAVGIGLFAGFVGLTAFRRWGWSIVRLGPLRLEVFGTNLGMGIAQVEPWGWARWYSIGDLTILNKEPDEVIIRVTIPAYFANSLSAYHLGEETGGGPYWEIAESINSDHCFQVEGEGHSLVFIPNTVSGRMAHLPTEIALAAKRGHVRGHVELKVELGSYQSHGDPAPSREQQDAWMDYGEEGLDSTKVVFTDLITKRRLETTFGSLRSLHEAEERMLNRL